MDTIFFIPGHGCTARVFEAQMHALANSYRCVPVDLRHYQTRAEVEADILAKAPDQFFILGFSLGACIAMSVAQQVPERIKGWIHISLPFEGPPPGLVEDLHHVQGLLPTITMSEYIELAYQKYFSHKAKEGALFDVFAQMMLETGKAHYLEQAHMLLTPWALQPTAHDHHPVLILGGAIDGRAKPEYHQAMAKQLKTATLHLLPDTGHFVTLEQPDLSSQIICDWLD